MYLIFLRTFGDERQVSTVMFVIFSKLFKSLRKLSISFKLLETAPEEPNQISLSPSVPVST